MLDERLTKPNDNSPSVNQQSSIAAVRPAVAEDLPALLDIENASFSNPWTANSLTEALQEARTIVLAATVAGRVCGYGVAWTVLDEGDLTRLAIDPAARRLGLGTLLTQALLQACQACGAHRVFLEVRVGNEQARRLYDRQGFKQVGLRRNYYGDGEDAVVMQWNVKTE